MKQILIATQNVGKFREMMEVLGDSSYEFLSLKDVDIDPKLIEAFEEDGETFEENSLKKAKYFSEITGLPALGEDSGILVDSLPGELGVFTRRWGAGASATDEEWIAYFLERMRDVEEGSRGAEFVCVSTVYGLDENPHVFAGKTRGMITRELEAPIYKGLPLSSCFRPEGFETVYSALAVEEKNRVSHRGKALHQVHGFLKNFHI